MHFREREGGLVVAEGAEFVSALPSDCIGLRTSSGFAYQQFFLSYNGFLTRMSDSKKFLTRTPDRILIYRAPDGKEDLISVGKNEVFFHDGDAGGTIKGLEGGTAACLAYERLFTAKGEMIHWSNPLAPKDFTRSISGAGYAELPSFEGEILEMIPYRGDIVLIREHGVTVLRVKGEPLSYSAESMPCAFGRIYPNTIRLCGERIVFLSESGLCAFDGSHIRRIPGCGFEEIDLTNSDHFNSAAVHGGYYLAVIMKDGNKRLWAVDPEKERGHFICITSRSIIGGDELLFAEEGKLYRMTARGVPKGGESAWLECERSLLGISVREKFLDSVGFDGRGFLVFEATSEHGKTQRVFGRAGERLKFPVPLRGTGFSVRIETVCEEVYIKNITFDVREEYAWTSTSSN